MRTEICIRFDYGRIVPWVRRTDGQLHGRRRPGRAVAALAPSPLQGEDYAHTARVHGLRGRAHAVRPHLAPLARAPSPSRSTPYEQLAETERWWREWVAQCTYAGPVARGRGPLADHAQGADLRAHRRHRRRRHDLAARGHRRRPQLGLPLLLAARRHLHALRAAARPATWTRPAPGASGCCGRSRAAPEELQIMYGVAGERRLTELELDWLPGYEGSRPVRIGNAAANQLQLDVYGEVDGRALPVARQQRHRARRRTPGRMQRALMDFLEAHWDEPGRGHLGGPRPAPALHPLQGDGVGGLRPGRQAGRGVRPDGPGRALAGAARPDPRRGLREGLRPGARHLHPVVRLAASWTPAC